MIDFKHTKHYTLSIRLSTDGFCFTVHNPLADEQYAYLPYRIAPLKSLTANLRAALQENDMLRHTYAMVNVVVAEAAYTIVPKEYYDESYKDELYRQNFPLVSDSLVVLHNLVSDEQAVVLFGMERQLYQLISERFPKAMIYASVSALMDFAAEKSFAHRRNYCLAHLNKRGVDLLCFANGVPLFVNTFACRNTDDALYLMLNSWQMLGLSQLDDALYLVGDVRKVNSLSKELEKFIKHIHVIRPADEFHSTELARIGEMPFDLQTLVACE